MGRVVTPQNRAYSGGVIASASSGGGGGGSGPDPSLLLHMEGANGGTTFVDSSEAGRTITRTGGTTSASQYKFGSSSFYSYYFSPANQYITAPDVSDSDFDWYQKDFTLEYWYFTSSSYGYTNLGYLPGGTSIARLVANPNGSVMNFGLGPNAAGHPTFNYYNGSGHPYIRQTTAPSHDVWHHIAMTHVFDTHAIYLLLDGNRIASGTVSGTPQYTPSGGIRVGVSGNPAHVFVDELACFDEALYTEESYTVPTSPYS